MISYDKLWQTMKEKGVTQYTLIKKYNISPGQITRLKRNESVSTHTIEMFCKILKCNVEDVMQYIDDLKENIHKSIKNISDISFFVTSINFIFYSSDSICSISRLLNSSAVL